MVRDTKRLATAGQFLVFTGLVIEFTGNYLKAGMGNKRKFVHHTKWTAEEVEKLTTLYPNATHDDLTAALPGRHIRMIQCKANGIGLVREKPPARTAGQIREAKRKHMAERRAANPEKARAYQAQHRAKNRDQLNAVRRAAHKGRIFWVRSLKFKGVKAKDLSRLWKMQRGLCALTGRKLDRTAQVDHKIPLARGGGDNIENLQWTTAEANRAKRDLKEDEFLELCLDASAWIGQRIDAAVRRLR